MNLEQRLKELSADFKERFISARISWAENYFAHYSQWVKDYREGKFGFGTASKEYVKIDRLVIIGDNEKYISAEIEKASNYYDDAIAKLAHRLSQKNMNAENIQITCEHKSDLYFTVTDGVKTYTAYTIVAFGCIQRPHYRFLIK